MIRLELSAEADADLTDILYYGIVTFGADIADAYLASFEEAFDLIRRHPMTGVFIDVVRPLIRALPHRTIAFYMTCSRIMSWCSGCCMGRWMWRSGWVKSVWIYNGVIYIVNKSRHSEIAVQLQHIVPVVTAPRHIAKPSLIVKS